MYISRWIARGITLLAAAGIVLFILRPIANPGNLTTSDQGYPLVPNVVMLFIAFCLVMLAIGQLQYAMFLHRLYLLLQDATYEVNVCQFVSSDQTRHIMVTNYGDGKYWVEVRELSDVLEEKVYRIDRHSMSVHLRTLADITVLVSDDGAYGEPQVLSNVIVLRQPDYKAEMRDLISFLQERSSV